MLVAGRRRLSSHLLLVVSTTMSTSTVADMPTDGQQEAESDRRELDMIQVSLIG